MKTHNVVLFSTDFRDLQYLWNLDYDHSSWKIEKAIKYKWNWKKFKMGYHLEIRKLTEEEMNDPFYKIHKGNVMSAMIDVANKGTEVYKSIIEIEKRRYKKLNP